MKVSTEEGARILDQGEIVPGHLGSAHYRRSSHPGADTRVLAAVIRGAVAPTLPVNALNKIKVPVLILNGKADLANQKVVGFLKGIPTARFAQCGGDHLSTPFEPTFHRAVVEFFREQWRLRAAPRRLASLAPGFRPAPPSPRSTG